MCQEYVYFIEVTVINGEENLLKKHKLAFVKLLPFESRRICFSYYPARIISYLYNVDNMESQNKTE